MHHLSIDLETYSSVPLAKAGAQKYIQSPDFEILLFAFSLDGAPVEIIDLARGERLPPWLVQAITSPEHIKHAYNAPFEWGCLSKYLGTLPPNQWRCTMFHGLYCGYEMARDPKTDGGVDTLYTRQRKVFSPFGISYEKTSQTTLSPTDAELANGANWCLVHSGESGEGDRSYIAHKAIPIARILSRG